ncbi:MAG: putative sulfate exporter family transporter, partial [Pseudomonadales bacterium]|nr:putative sulfate exporter family transporter [Pseudomonadales bacterium]
GYVVGVLAIGMLLGRLIGLDRISTALMAGGTAICGGTTIATLSPILAARPEQTGVAIGIVFLLNALALITFPALGAWLGMSEEAFGVFVALAVHDTSSVVATAAAYGDRALEVATTVKLGRTLWLIPLAIGASVIMSRSQAQVRVPGFILAFVAASILATLLEIPRELISIAGLLSKGLLVGALFFVGTEMSRTTVLAIRGRVLVHALVLWGLALAGTLTAVLAAGLS